MMTTTMRGLLVSSFLICGLPALAEEALPGVMAKTAMGEAMVDTQGMPLYTLETDKDGHSSCNDDCTAKWLPLPVVEGAKPVHDWSVVVRDDGTRMWAYKGQPVYTYVDDKADGYVTGDGLGGFHAAGLSDADRAAFVKASFAVAVMGTTTAGPAWVDSKGMALYTYEKDGDGKSMCNDDCAKNWPPLMVADGGVATGDWTIIARDDGKMMWAFKGHPLYTFVNDKAPGEVTGDGVNGFHLAM